MRLSRIDGGELELEDVLIVPQLKSALKTLLRDVDGVIDRYPRENQQRWRPRAVQAIRMDDRHPASTHQHHPSIVKRSHA